MLQKAVTLVEKDAIDDFFDDGSDSYIIQKKILETKYLQGFHIYYNVLFLYNTALAFLSGIIEDVSYPENFFI